MNGQVFSVRISDDLVRMLEKVEQVTGDRRSESIRRVIEIGARALLGADPDMPGPTAPSQTVLRMARNLEVAQERLRATRARYAEWISSQGEISRVTPKGRMLEEEWRGKIRIAELRVEQLGGPVAPIAPNPLVAPAPPPPAPPTLSDGVPAMDATWEAIRATLAAKPPVDTDAPEMAPFLRTKTLDIGLAQAKAAKDVGEELPILDLSKFR